MSSSQRTAIRKDISSNLILTIIQKKELKEKIILKNYYNLNVSNKSLAFLLSNEELNFLIDENILENQNFIVRFSYQNNILKIPCSFLKLSFLYNDNTFQDNAQNLGKITLKTLIEKNKIKNSKIVFMFEDLTYENLDILKKIH